MSCDCSHMPLHCQIKEKEKSKEKNIKSRELDKRKKILVSKCTITSVIFSVSHNCMTMPMIDVTPFCHAL